MVQLYCELCCDEAQAAARWRAVLRTLLSGDGTAELDLAEVFGALVLSSEEKQRFK